MKVPVVSITRECQHVWDGQWGRVRCGKLAYFTGINLVNGVQHIYFRCAEHKNDDPSNPLGPMTDVIEQGATFGLGYRP